MIVNKERVKAFIDMTREDARKASSLGRLSKYSFEGFCREHGLFNGSERIQSGGTVISCPFHQDDAPSCSLNDELGVFNCFSCGGGNFWKFVYRWHTEVLGEQTNYYSLLNRYLQEDQALMVNLQFNTLYDAKSVTKIEDVNTVKKFKFKRDSNKPTNYLDLQRMLLKKNPSLTEVKLFITLMQEDVPVDVAYEELIVGSRKSKDYDLAEMMAFE